MSAAGQMETVLGVKGFHKVFVIESIARKCTVDVKLQFVGLCVCVRCNIGNNNTFAFTVQLFRS